MVVAAFLCLCIAVTFVASNNKLLKPSLTDTLFTNGLSLMCAGASSSMHAQTPGDFLGERGLWILHCSATGMRQPKTLQATSEDPALTALCCLLCPGASEFLFHYMPTVGRPANWHASHTPCCHSDMLNWSYQLRSSLSERIRMRAELFNA